MAVQNFGSGGGGQQLSPGVNISEIDLTTVVPQVSTTVGGFAGAFRWGPVEERTLITSENDLVSVFGRPTNLNPETWFTAANFLSYSNALYVVRAANTSTVLAAVANTAGGVASSNSTVKNTDDYDAKPFGAGVHYAARWAGEIGNSLKISVCDNANQFNSSIATSFSNSTVTTNTETSIATINVGSRFINAIVSYVGTLQSLQAEAISTTGSAVRSKITVGDYIEVGNSTIGKQQLKVTGLGGVNAVTDGGFGGITWFRIAVDQPLKIKSNFSSNSITRYWEYYNQVDAAPGQSTWQGINGNTSANDEMHIVVADEDGAFTSSPGAILEVYKGLSRATDSKLADGSTNYYKNVLNERSGYVWFANDRTAGDSNTGINLASTSNTLPFTLSFRGGTDESESAMSFADIARGYDLFASTDDVDISLLMTGTSRSGDGTVGEQLGNYLIDNIAEVRKDCIVFVSPVKDDVVNAGVSAADNIVEFRNELRSSSYAVLDSGYKYQYDKYNDLYRWIPLNGDIAGLCVRTDSVRDPWYSPAGVNRGQVKNVVKLAFNPNLPQRDLLYKNGINPVISQRGEGVILNGDKTLLNRPSAFDRINVRRLFIVLEKAISRAAKSFLFEFNDEFTRAQFRNIVEPYLRDIQGRRGIYDFRVVCDATNNTPEVIDANRFVGDIYIKPARSINFIQLNFVAVRSGIEFSEIVG